MLKALMIKRSIDLKRAELEELRKRETEFETREAEPRWRKASRNSTQTKPPMRRT